MIAAEVLARLGRRSDEMSDHVVALAEINSGSFNVDGVNRCGERMADLVAALDPDAIDLEPVVPTPVVGMDGREVDQPVGEALVARKRADAPVRVCLFGHLDTVFPPEHSFQSVARAAGRLHGPGVADCKGGLVLAVEALRLVETLPISQHLGWELLAVPDEEVGSVGSKPLLARAAARNHLGLGYEPALPDGGVAAARKGSLNFHLMAEGRSAHVGRNHADGVSAVRRIARAIEELEHANETLEGVTLSCGRVGGGGVLNVVPDFAIASFNARVDSDNAERALDAHVARATEKHGGAQRIADVRTVWTSRRPPKPVDQVLGQLLDGVQRCASELGVEVPRHDTGGSCDGNDLASFGLVNVDSLGARGAGIHTADEHAEIDGLVERAALTVLLLRDVVAGALVDGVGLSEAGR